MKRRQVIQGLLGVGAAAITANWGGGSLLSSKQAHLSGLDANSARSLIDLDLQLELSALDPLSDNERPAELIVAQKEPIITANPPLINHSAVSSNAIDNPTANATAYNISAQDIDARDANTMSTQTSKVAAAKTHSLQETSQDKQKAAKVVDKAVNFSRNYNDDVFVSKADAPLLRSTFTRLKNLQKTIGYGHFNLVSFDESIRFAKRYSAIGAFSKEELAFIEKLFFTDAANYGFYGKKVSNELTGQFNKAKVIKIPRSGHYIFKDESLSYYQKLKNDVGNSIILTSGIRSNVKQLYLFLAKTIRVDGNLSRASRSLAPPGYSYHGIGDFDVGRIGWGGKNFTDDFASTDEYKKMQDLGYIAIRYDHGNKLGVRFEPWHIKVV